MNWIKNTYRRLDAIQNRWWFCIAVTILCVGACGAYFGTLLWTTSAIHEQRQTLILALQGQNLDDRDEHAVTLNQFGTVTIDRRTYGGEEFRDIARTHIDRNGDVVSVRLLVERLLSDQKPGWAPEFLHERPETTLTLGLVTLGWLLLIIWLGATFPFLLTAMGTAIPAGLAWVTGSEGLMVSVIGIGLLTFTFVLLVRALLVIFQYPAQPMAVAHTVVKEASRKGIALVFIVALLLLLPLIPLGLNEEEQLRYQVQAFMNRSLTLTFGVAACMTLFLACSTVAFEIRDRQIWQLVSKPVSRLNYIVGKWLGIIGINIALLIVCSVSIFFFVQYLRTLPAASAYDRLAIRDEVLTARSSARVDVDYLTSQQLEQRVRQRVERDPESYGRFEDLGRTEFQNIAERIQQEYVTQQWSVPPQSARSYTFSGLGGARDMRSTLTLRYKFYIGIDSTHETYDVVFQINDDERHRVRQQFVPTMVHTVPLPPDMIRDDGTLELTIANPNTGGRSINFDHENVEVLYKVGNFEGNFVRALLLMWAQLAFLALLGITFATFLSFPVACLAAFTAFGAWSISPFVAAAMQQYHLPPLDQIDWNDPSYVFVLMVTAVVRAISLTVIFITGQMGDYAPRGDLVDGRYISWTNVVVAFGRLVFIWCGGLLLGAYLILRRRELATYSGYG